MAMSSSERHPLSCLEQPAWELLRQRLQAVRSFLSVALPIANAHTGDFYTRGVWDELVCSSPEAVLAAFTRHHPPEQRHPEPTRTWDENELSKIFCKASHRLVDLESFLQAANHHSLSHLGVCTPLSQLLGFLNEREHDKPDEKIKTDEFMNHKKAHEVLVMSRLIDSIARYCGIKQVIDLGSGKGYLSSFLSMHYDLKVYGIDSSSTNTHGATERNRKLKKYWKVYRSRARADSKGQLSETTKEREAFHDNSECKGSINGKLLSNNNIDLGQDQDKPDLSPVNSSGSFTGLDLSDSSELNNQYCTVPDTNKSPASEFSFLSILPADAVEVEASPKLCQRVLSEEERKNRKMTNIKAKAKRLKESNLYSPLTSYITAETELHDVIVDLEDSIMVGLHTCGDLSPNTLRIFVGKPEIKAVCSVGCCYHLLSEEFEVQPEENTVETWGFPMCQDLKEEGWCCGRNARMSACLALDRVAVGQGLPLESLFYRAVLQVIIKECYGNVKSDRRVGKAFSKSSCFLDYCRESLKNLGLDESKLPDSCLMEYYEMYKSRMKELEAFNMLKVVLSPCIEALILLDRLCYLREQGNVVWSGMVKLFDPVKSPRCYAVIGVKKL